MTRILAWISGLFPGNNPLFAAALLCLLTGGALGWTANDLVSSARIANLEAARDRARAEAGNSAVKALQAARKAEDIAQELALAQTGLESQRQQLGKEKDDALKKITTGRPCLDPDALRLLNGSGDGFRLPARSGLHPDAASAPAADSGGSGGIAAPHAPLRPPPPLGSASDAAVALWARHARDQYDLCRARIDTLRQIQKEYEHGNP
jgi:hypothetical protein